MEFATKYVRSKDTPEVNSGEKLVETAGYLPAEKRITNIMLAGQRLSDYRKATFDFPDGNIDEDFYDPTRDKNFDIVDAQNLASTIKPSQTAQEAPGELPNVPEGYTLVKNEIAPE
jgi:hypothetical protein